MADPFTFCSEAVAGSHEWGGEKITRTIQAEYRELQVCAEVEVEILSG